VRRASVLHPRGRTLAAFSLIHWPSFAELLNRESGVRNTLAGCMNPLTSGTQEQSVRKLVAFYVTQHNQTMPHSAFEGQTPDEMYRGRGDHVPDELAARRHAARQQRVASNRAAACPRAAPLRDRDFAA